ncbi:MAG: hypothetical protein AAB535_04225 [Patescibacteria group bacterium]
MSANEPPLVDVKVTNPVTYLRRFWQKVMDGEGVDFRFRIHPVTAVLCVFAIAVAAFGAGRYSIKIPFLKYEVIPTSVSTTQEVWKETAFTGKLQYSVTGDKFFLLTTSSEAITLSVPKGLDLMTLVGKRIFAVGQYNKSERLLKVIDVKDLEVLPQTPIPIPTVSPTPEPTFEPTLLPIGT